MEGQIILFMISKDKQYGTELGYSFLHHKPLCSNGLDVLMSLQTAFSNQVHVTMGNTYDTFHSALATYACKKEWI